MAEDVKHLMERLGYSYFKIGESISADEAIIKIISGEEARFVKAIPFIVYLSGKEKNIVLDFGVLIKNAKKKNLLPEAKAILYATLKILNITEKSNKLVPQLQKLYGTTEENLLDAVFHSKEYVQFNRNSVFSQKKITGFREKLSKVYFRFDELLYEFSLQKALFEAKEKLSLADKLSISKEKDLQYALNTLFKPKQLEIINKVADNRKLTKVEYDYYFKTIKKRLRAAMLIAEFADTLVQKKVSKESIS